MVRGKMVPEKWSPGKMVPRKMVPGKMVPGKMVPRKMVLGKMVPGKLVHWETPGCHWGNAIQTRGSSSPKVFLG